MHISYGFDCGPIFFLVVSETFTLDQCIAGLMLVFFQLREERGYGGVVEDYVGKWFGPFNE